MAMVTSLFSLFFLLFLFNNTLSSTANVRKTSKLLRSNLLFQPATTTTHLNNTPPTVYFEVTKPIKLPKTKPCSHLILQHDFGFTYGRPPVLANYSPPLHCPSNKFSKIVLEWKATCKGRQFDRIFGVWLSGVEILRSCTAEPRPNGIVWNVKKDVTRYYSLLMKNQTLAVYMGNLVDKTYTGVYHVNVTVHFYPAEEEIKYHKPKSADLVLPISRDLPLNDGLWFQIKNSTDTQLKEFEVPQNIYRAVLEVYVSFHENDEFWYGNPPNEYLAANNITDLAGNGPFREVTVSLDGELVGAVWPFTVIYTGGVNPLLWRPISGIGSFNLPSYDLEITPFLGNMLDGKTHKIGFSVTNALNVWYVDANLHLWLDTDSVRTEGKLSSHSDLPLGVSSVLDFKGLNGTFVTGVRRSIYSTGWVRSSHGIITTHSIQNFSYSNTMVMGKNGDLQIINQTINFNDSVISKTSSSSVLTIKSLKTFPFYLYSENLDQGNKTSLSVANVTLGFNEKKLESDEFRSSTISLKNLQNGQGVMVVKNNLVIRGVGSTQQVYRYDGGKFCYSRNISSSNYTILYDVVTNTCHNRKQLPLAFGFSRWFSFPARRAFRESELLGFNSHS